MARLRVITSRKIDISGFGVLVPLQNMSQKQITKAVRDALCKKYGAGNVKVSRTAMLEHQIWSGTCWINGEKSIYKLGLVVFEK